MTIVTDPLLVIATPPPRFAAEQVRRLVCDEYGLDGELAPLVSERDQNFLLTTHCGTRYVVKIANAAEDHVVTDFQVRALQHLQQRACRVAVPNVVPTSAGSAMTVISAAERHKLRVVSYLDGCPLEAATVDKSLARQLGSSLGEIGAALRDFEHPGENQSLLWDIRRTDALRDLLLHIGDAQLRATISQCFDDLDEKVAPQLDSLRSQVIHNDLNPGNVLVSKRQPRSVAGVIDFGDMMRAPLIIDVAVAAAYQRSEQEDALELLAPFVAGYDAVTPLEDAEFDALYDLVRARLATSLAILHWRVSERDADDAYTTRTLHGGQSARRFLDRLDAIPRDDFAARVRENCSC